MNIENKCIYCKTNPKAHSFYYFKSSKDKKLLYKTIIAEADFFDKPDTIIHHINNDLQLKSGTKWEWIIDFRDASFKHYMAFNTVRIISKWINDEREKKCKELRKIYLINGKKILINPMIWVSRFFLPSHIEIICS